MEWKLSDVRKAEYERAMRTAQDVEANVGATQYRISKLLDVRKDMDTQVKKWWDEVIKEMNLDTKRDYMITMDGIIKDVTKEAPAAPLPVQSTEEIQKFVDEKVTT